MSILYNWETKLAIILLSCGSHLVVLQQLLLQHVWHQCVLAKLPVDLVLLAVFAVRHPRSIHPRLAVQLARQAQTHSILQDILGRLSFEYSFNLATNLSKSSCFCCAVSSARRRRSGLYLDRISSSLGDTHITNAGPPTQVTTPLQLVSTVERQRRLASRLPNQHLDPGCSLHCGPRE